MNTQVRFDRVQIAGDFTFLKGEVSVYDEDSDGPNIVITLAIPYRGDGTIAALRAEFENFARAALNEAALVSWWQAHAQ